MSSQLKIKPELCIGCRSCEVICSLENEDLMAASGSRINVISFIESTALGMPYHLPVTCYQCADAPCMNVCPENALKKDEDVVHLDLEKCTGCRKCIKACPFGVIRWDDNFKKIVKCELCNGAPACVDICPSGAILFETLDFEAPDSISSNFKISGPFYAREKAFEIKAYQVLKQDWALKKK